MNRFLISSTSILFQTFPNQKLIEAVIAGCDASSTEYSNHGNLSKKLKNKKKSLKYLVLLISDFCSRGRRVNELRIC